MDLRFSPEDEAFRQEVRRWLEENLTREIAPRDWERRLGAAGWNCLGWPREHGGRQAPLSQQILFNEEYSRSGAPARLGVIGEGLLGPTLIELGTAAQKRRFLPPIVSGEELWCQGYSEPGAGSDLASVQTRAVLRGGEWVITGQKVWTSLAHLADWCFVLCRTDLEAPRHKGLSYLLVPMRQPGVSVRPIVQMTGTSEFSEVFFDEARTSAENVVGEVNGGWRVALVTLAHERGAATIGKQIGFEAELQRMIALARRNGASADPLLRQRLVRALCGLRVMRWNVLRGLAPSIIKLYWATWHQDLGKLAMDVLGPSSEIAGDPEEEVGLLQRMFLFSRADTIYAGSNEIQRNIIAERVLGLPR